MPGDQPAETILREEAFAALLLPRAAPLRGVLEAVLTGSPPTLGKAAAADLLRACEELESFLDDHGARWNRRFAPVTELVAGLRSLAGAFFHLAHVQRRLPSYRLIPAIDDDRRQQWVSGLERSITFVRGACHRLASTCAAHFVRLEQQVAASGSGTANGTVTPISIGGAAAILVADGSPKLPRTLLHDEPHDEEQKIARVATDYVELCEEVRPLIQAGRTDHPAGPWVRASFSEARARTLAARVHNLQSAYDTYVGNTILESRDPRLAQLRGHSSLALHLFQAGVHLVHFRERYEAEDRATHLEEVLTSLVDPDELHGVVRDDLVLVACDIVLAGEDVARALVPSYTRVRERRIVLDPETPLHARPAALVVAIVNHHGTPVELEIEGAICNAASILEILMAVGSHPGASHVLFRGDERPLADIERLFAARLGEEGLESLPPELAYLRS